MTESMKISERAGRKIQKATELTLRRGNDIPYPSQPRGRRGTIFDAVLTEDLDAGALDAPTTANANLWHPDPDDTDEPPVYVESDEEITVVNRSVSLSGASGTYVMVTRVANEWRCIWADCAPA